MLTFNLNRVKALFIREFYIGFKPAITIVFIITSAIFLANLIIAIASGDTSDGNFEIEPFVVKYGIMLMIGGFFYASLAFKEFAKLPTRAEYLALPGSSLEKVFVKWLFTNPIFILVFTSFFWLITSLLAPYIADIRGYTYESGLFSSNAFWNLVGIYFIIHSIFFFGSIAFNRVPIVLTILSVLVIVLALGAINALFFRLVWANIFDGLFTVNMDGHLLEFGDRYDNPSQMWQVQFFIFAFKFLLAPVLWIASIFKFSEKQV